MYDLIGLGELLWDVLPTGKLPGGATANVAYHGALLGLKTAVATRVGTDDLGRELVDFLKDRGLETRLVQNDPVRATSTVTVQLNAAGVASYVFSSNCAWDGLEWSPAWQDAFAMTRAVCVGTLAQRSIASRETIQTALATAAEHGAAILYDINLRPPYDDDAVITSTLVTCRLVKFNDEEQHRIATLCGLPPDAERSVIAAALFDKYPAVEKVIITCGSKGAWLADRTGEETISPVLVKVVDTVGAGDAFSAAILYAHLAGWSLSRTLWFANQLGALVASRAGAMPGIREDVEKLKAAAVSCH